MIDKRTINLANNPVKDQTPTEAVCQIGMNAG